MGLRPFHLSYTRQSPLSKRTVWNIIINICREASTVLTRPVLEPKAQGPCTAHPTWYESEVGLLGRVNDRLVCEGRNGCKTKWEISPGMLLSSTCYKMIASTQMTTNRKSKYHRRSTVLIGTQNCKKEQSAVRVMTPGSRRVSNPGPK